MILGILFGIVFCHTMYGDEKDAPLVPLNYGPFVNGTLYLGKKHIHHWMVFWLLCMLTIYYSVDVNMISFCASMVIHGLSYKDCFEI